jgi:heme/copper-type cytochrome/quinol oxidase subunit 1
MKKAWLIVRLGVETTFGLIYMSGLLLLLSVCNGSFPQRFFLGYLGMPRRYDASNMDKAAVAKAAASWQEFNAISALIGLLVVAFLLMNSLLWFKDVLAISRKLKTGRRAPSYLP